MVENSPLVDSPLPQYSLFRMIGVGIVHIGVGIGIVAISSFLNSELAFAGWNEGTISIYLGIPILFELTRLLFGYLYDSRGWLLRSLVFGTILGTIGLLFAPAFITPINNYLIIINVSLFYAGTAILTTLVDANMTESETLGEKGRVAGVIQTLRLLGFALGGFIGSYLYISLSFDIFFTILSISFLIFSIISLLAIEPVESSKIMDGESASSLSGLITTLKEPIPILMMIFLIIYPIGLFMQDLLLEPFAINQLGFNRDNVGRIVAIWTSLTLFFVPIGVKMESSVGKRIPIIGGEFLAIIGLVIIGFTYYNPIVPLFYLGIVFFGIGNGLASGPAISVMLDVASLYQNQIALLLGMFGLFNTIGRFLAAIVGGLVLFVTGTNYFILFIVEAFIVLIGLIPLIFLMKKMDPIIEYSQMSSSSIKQENLFPILDF